MAVIKDLERMKQTDKSILAALREQIPEYVALVANRCGLHLARAEERCELLKRRGIIERTSDEVTYRITVKGESYLNAVANGMTDDSSGELFTDHIPDDT